MKRPCRPSAGRGGAGREARAGQVVQGAPKVQEARAVQARDRSTRRDPAVTMVRDRVPAVRLPEARAGLAAAISVRPPSR